MAFFTVLSLEFFCLPFLMNNRLKFFFFFLLYFNVHTTLHSN